MGSRRLSKAARRARDLGAVQGYARTAMLNTAASWFRRKSWRRELPSAVVPERAYVEDATATL